MSSTLRRLSSLLSFGLALLPAARAGATSAPSVYENAQGFPMGSRAAGMGGAYTALACDEGALHYNPAALACARNSRVELAANAYMLEHFDAPNSLGPGQDITSTSYHPLPSIAGFVRKLSDGDPETHAGALGFGFTVSVPRSIFLVVDPPDPTKKDFFSISVRDELLAGDLGLGWQLSRSFALGFSLGGVMRSVQSREGLLLVGGTASACGDGQQCFDFVSADSSEELLAIGGRAKLGVRWSPTESLSVGLMVVSPSIDLYGSATINDSVTVAIAGTDMAGMPVVTYLAVPSRRKGTSDLSLPGKIVAGVAYSTPQLTLSVDVSAVLPRTVRTAHDLEEIPIEGVEPSTDPIPDRSISLELRPNVNVGAELRIVEGLVIDLGFFTDLSLTSDEDLAADRADRINLFGGTLALGILGRQIHSWFGLSFAAGSGTTRVRSESLSFEQIASGSGETVESTYSRWSLVGILGTSYSFIDDDKLPPE